MPAQRPGEFELIERYLAPLATDPGSFELIDDVAVLTPPAGEDLVLTKDMVAAGVHFFADDPASAIAQKALRVNLSDLAAKGARPLGYLLGLGLGRDWEEAWVADFCAGLAADQQQYGIALYGGDTIRSGNGMVLSVTAIGSLPAGTAVRRSGARPGDLIYVTGTIGDAALGLKLRLEPDLAARWDLSPEQQAFLTGRYLLPRPRVSAAGVVRRFARASMDVSDGLVGDLAKLAKASGVNVAIEAGLVPLSEPAARAGAADRAALAAALTGGDDYELLMAVAAEDADAFEAAMAAIDLPAARIGRASEGRGNVRLMDANGDTLALEQTSYSHF